MTEIIHKHGQKIVYNPERKLMKTVIETPFMAAGKLLIWDISKYGCPGIGLNEDIIKLVLKTKSTLIVYVLATPLGPVDKDYWITPDKLKQFIENNNSTYRMHGTNLSVIPWNLFQTHKVPIPA